MWKIRGSISQRGHHQHHGHLQAVPEVIGARVPVASCFTWKSLNHEKKAELCGKRTTQLDMNRYELNIINLRVVSILDMNWYDIFFLTWEFFRFWMCFTDKIVPKTAVLRASGGWCAAVASQRSSLRPIPLHQCFPGHGIRWSFMAHVKQQKTQWCM